MFYDPRRRLGGTSQLGSVQQWGRPGVIARLTRIDITIAGADTSGTQTLSPAVNTENSVLVWGGINGGAETTNPNVSFSYLTLTNSTTVTAVRNTNDVGVQVTGQLLEFVPGVLRSIQRGTVSMAAASSVAVTITAVVVANTAISILGNTSPNGDFSADNDLVSGLLTNATTLTLTRGGTTGACVVSYEVWEFNV